MAETLDYWAHPFCSVANQAVTILRVHFVDGPFPWCASGPSKTKILCPHFYLSGDINKCRKGDTCGIAEGMNA